MKPLILLQTDFSNTWSAVASMKGVIKIVDRELEIYDLCHDIKAFDPWEASLSLNTCEPYWPKGTVIVSVVDPGVGTSRKASVALLNDGTYVVTPDNGSLTHLKYSVGIKAIREIDETRNRYEAKENVSVFHGRDLFGYCAALLASGKINFEEVGPEYPVSDVVECREYSTKPLLSNGYCEAFIMTGLKHFGGIQFNISNAEWEECGFVPGDMIEVVISYKEKAIFNKEVLYGKSFGDVNIGEPVLYRGSSLYLCLDLNCANFMSVYKIGTGLEYTATLKKVK
ncbi:MAG: SAM-dependent chlorinase/fluorinase [Solobacterium sp.]|nr:SAM-dependent chlorinase/fluorinase [Solobacterium sp.]MDD6886731.1 SAM-dependent chlorinase/fluorinase [Solobacterium sp.]MDY5654135.1 SAM-dependent chlorinase/fluorinase [Erysipelotrichaceae bacterium]